MVLAAAALATVGATSGRWRYASNVTFGSWANGISFYDAMNGIMATNDMIEGYDLFVTENGTQRHQRARSLLAPWGNGTVVAMRARGWQGAPTGRGHSTPCSPTSPTPPSPRPPPSCVLIKPLSTHTTLGRRGTFRATWAARRAIWADATQVRRGRHGDGHCA